MCDAHINETLASFKLNMKCKIVRVVIMLVVMYYTFLFLLDIIDVSSFTCVIDFESMISKVNEHIT